MDTRELIASFHEEGADQGHVVRLLEAAEGDESALFLAEIVKDDGQDDTLRAEAAKALQYREFASEESRRAAAASLVEGPQSVEELVQSHCGKALWKHFSVPGGIRSFGKLRGRRGPGRGPRNAIG